MVLAELTKRLCALSGPSGFEEPVRAWIAEYLTPFADEVRTDALGNMIAIKRCGKPGAKLVVLDAHMDEIGFIVTGAEKGYLSFGMLGGVDQRMLPAREVKVLTEPPLFGVIATMPPHVLTEDEKSRAIEPDKLFIDVGLTQEEAEKAVPPGTPVVYAAECEELGTGLLCGKALDDRACAAIIIKAFERLSQEELNADVCCLVSTQEEVGHRGAKVAAWGLEPDVALVVDVTHGKTPDAPNVPCSCGKGAAICMGPNINGPLSRELFSLAKERGIAHQPKAEPGGNSGTNAEAIQISREGVVTGLIGLPLKYMHTPVEVVALSDMEAITELLAAYVEGLEV